MLGHKRVVFRKKEHFGKGRNLFADLYFPKRFKKKKGLDRVIIVLLHGLGSDRKTILRTVDKKILQDYLIFIPELKTITHPNGKENILKVSANEIEFYIKKAQEYGENVFLCGHSLGGYLSLYTFSRKKVEKYLKGLCLISTPYSLKDVMFRLSINLVEFLGERIDEVGKVIKKLKKQIPGLRYSPTKKRVYFYKFKFSTVKDVKGLYDAPNVLKYRTPPMPTLIIHGIEDKIVNFSHGVKLFQKFKEEREDTELMLIPFANHAILKKKKIATKRIKSWIKSLMDIEREKESQEKLIEEMKRK